MACSRCGRVTDVEYGSDGLAYCSSCIFYGTNKQCWKCRMYLPGSELQQYGGMWVCPYCLQDMRDENRRTEEKEDKKDRAAQVLSYPETCERCGRDLNNVVYIWNGKRLCKRCVDEEKDKWDLVGGGPSGAPYRISLEPSRKSKSKSILERAISAVRGVFGLKRSKAPPQQHEHAKMPIDNAKPMVERKTVIRYKKDDEKSPQAEGIFTKRPIRDETQNTRTNERTITAVPIKKDMEAQNPTAKESVSSIVAVKNAQPAKKQKKAREKRKSGSESSLS